MPQSKKLYPYPVLEESGYAYNDSEFRMVCTPHANTQELQINVSVTLKNDELISLLEEGTIGLYCRVECPRTFLREIYEFSSFEEKIMLSKGSIESEISITAFLVAKKDIKCFQNKNFSDDYAGFSFSLEKGCVIGISETVKISIRKNMNELRSIPSIFLIVNSNDLGTTRISIDPDGDKIKIILPSQSYQQYRSLKGSRLLQPVLHSMLIIPALMELFEQMKSDPENIQYFSTKRWFPAINKATESNGCELSAEGLEKCEALELAQMILDGPITRGMTALFEYKDEDDEN